MTDDVTSQVTRKPPPHRPVPALHCYLAYFSALLVGIALWWLLDSRDFMRNPLWIGLIVTCGSTVTVWVFSIVNNNSSIYDPYWVIAPPVLALALKITGGGGLLGPWHLRQVLIIACLIIWASRYHIFYAWPGWRTGLVHEDWRYEKMRNAPVPYWLNSLVGMHLFPTVLVYFAFAPAALILLSSPASLPAFGVWDIVGTVAALSAVAIELTADKQLARYRSSSNYRNGGTFRGGLWKYSRHPNYFGESLFWVSMIPFAVAGGMLQQHFLLVIIGPIMMAAFFRFSCRLMDLRSLEHRPDYRKAMAEVSAMLPWFSKKERGYREESITG
jgi:steroid 5-alpha reductase family enzyme